MTQAEPLQFAIRIQDFDLGLLPIDERLLKSDPDMLPGGPRRNDSIETQRAFRLQQHKGS